MSGGDVLARLIELLREFESVAASDEDDPADLASADVIRDAIAEIVALRAAALERRPAGLILPFLRGCAPAKDRG